MGQNKQELQAANAAYAASFGDKADLPSAPTRHMALVTCMDARMDSAKFAGLEEGDAHVMRNAGARINDDTIRSLLASTLTMGVKEIFVVPHTSCGMSKYDDNTVVEKAVTALTKAGAAEAEVRQTLSENKMDWEFIHGEKETLLADVQKLVDLRDQGILPPDVSIYGLSYDIHTGLLAVDEKATEIGLSETPAFEEGNLPQILEANKEYAATYGAKAELGANPERKMAVIACMDSRVDPAKALGLTEGDSHVIRNAGGRVSDDAIRSALASALTMGSKEIHVMPHTSCGMSYLNNDLVGEKALATLVKAGVEEDVAKKTLEANPRDWMFIDHEEDTLLADVQKFVDLREKGLLPKDVAIYGHSYDVHTGRVIENPKATKLGAVALEQSTKKKPAKHLRPNL